MLTVFIFMYFYIAPTGQIIESACCAHFNDVLVKTGFTDIYDCIDECVSFKDKFCRNIEHVTSRNDCHGSSIPVALMPIRTPCGHAGYWFYARKGFENPGKSDCISFFIRVSTMDCCEMFELFTDNNACSTEETFSLILKF